MFNTRQPVLRNFWYAAVPVAQLDEGPKPFRILGQDIVLFLDATGEPAALEDRCCHRTAKLSKGWVRNGHIVCGYHGWEYDGSGKLVNIPQFPFEQAVPDARARPSTPRRATAMSGSVSANRSTTFPTCPTTTTSRSAAFTSSMNCGAARRSE